MTMWCIDTYFNKIDGFFEKLDNVHASVKKKALDYGFLEGNNYVFTENKKKLRIPLLYKRFKAVILYLI